MLNVTRMLPPMAVMAASAPDQSTRMLHHAFNRILTFSLKEMTFNFCI